MVSGQLLSINEITLDSHLIAEDKPELDALTKLQNKRRASFKFSMASIPIGSEISFINDDGKKARIIDDKRIEFEGQVTSLSALAQKLL